MYQGNTYTECKETSDPDDDMTWCYVEGGAGCADATKSTKTEGEYYRYCEDPCDCKDEFMYKGRTYTECTVTSEGGDSWCYVKGGAECTEATASSKTEGEYYKEHC